MILGSLVLFLLAADADAATYLTTLRTPLYASRSAKSVWLAALPAGVAVEVSFCSKAWCSATWGGQHGWIAHRDLKAAKPRQQSTGRGYRNSSGEWVPSPQLSPNGPPRGASAQCNDGTYSFSKHRSGTCSHHGGVQRWL
ncbi:MAG TPA: DUF3761 domain-containing protein [Thermoanaerobaculia bacterium]|nr:DUF3761 domain-containing protein [Thermoanaerobaculia bacterium]